MTGIKVSVLFEKLLDRTLRLRKPALIEIDSRDAKLGVERRWLELERFSDSASIALLSHVEAPSYHSYIVE
jgi:hypothetical protein